jgi:hypothetical protein
MTSRVDTTRAKKIFARVCPTATADACARQMHDRVGAFRGLRIKFICDGIPTDVTWNRNWIFVLGGIFVGLFDWRRRDNFRTAFVSQKARNRVPIFRQQSSDGGADESR